MPKNRILRNAFNRQTDDKALIQELQNKMGKSGSNYIFVPADGTPEENGEAFLNAYDEASLATPNGQPLSADNRFTIYLGAGYYHSNTNIIFDTDFVDIKSMDGERSAIITRITEFNAYDVVVVGIKVSTRFRVGENQDNAIFINCEGGARSFGYGGVFTSTFINCKGGFHSFGGADFNPVDGRVSSVMAGTCINCEAGDLSFSCDNNSVESGYFENCKGLRFCFGSNNGIHPQGSTHPLGGKYVNCVAESGFSAYDGKIIRCQLTEADFQELKSEYIILSINGDNTVITTTP